MNSNKKDNKKTIEKFVKINEKNFLKIYAVIHLILAMFAVGVSIKCENGFELVPVTTAILCPHFFLIFTAATRGIGSCFLSEDTYE
jgi:hypothetical protein